MNLNKSISLFFLFLSGLSFSQQLDEDTIFYDRSWHETENKVTAGYFRTTQKEDSLIHFWDYFTENKQLQNEGRYHEDDESRYGLYTWYHKSGKKSLEGKYIKNYRTGKWNSWYKNGNLKSTGLYEDNNRTEEWTWFHQDGSKQSIATYVENELTGKRTWWHKSGKIKQIGYFDKGLKVKEWETYYSDGTVSSKINYDKGQLQGLQTTYYKNGNTRSSETYESGILKTEEWFNEKEERVEKEEITSLKDNYALFWKISGNGLMKPSFLLGTMHIKDKKAFEYSDSLYKAFDSCEGYTMEILPDKFFEHNHHELNSHSYIFELGTELYYKEVNSDFYSGRPTHEDWWIQNVGALFHRDYFDPAGMPYFMDAYLYVKAGREGKFLGGLETVQDHLGTGSKLPNYQKNFDILSEFNPDKEMINTYLEGDIDKIEAFMNFISSEEFNYWLLTVRNHKMANTIDSLVQIRPTFNTAGAAHLPGEDGLIELLREKGYDVTKVISPFSKTPEIDLLEESKREWHAINHEEYNIEMPSLIGLILDKKQKWNICMDYLSEVAYAYTLIEGKNYSAKSLIPLDATNINKVKSSQYGEDVLEWGYEHNDHYYSLLQLKNGLNNLFIRVTTVNQKPTLPTYSSDILRMVNSVEWTEPMNLDQELQWKNYDSEYFSVFAPGEPVLDTTVYSLYNYSANSTSVIRFLFGNQNKKYIIREATELNSRRYEGFGVLADFTTEIYDSIFSSSATLSEVDTTNRRLYLEYQIDNQYKIIQMYRKGYATYTSISVCHKSEISQARKFHSSFKLKKLIASKFKTYSSPIDSFTINFPDVAVDFETSKKRYPDFNSKSEFDYEKELSKLIEYDYTQSHKNVYTFTYEVFDTLSKIKYEVISKKFRPFYQLIDTSSVMSSLFTIDREVDSVLYETSNTLGFYKQKSLGVHTRVQSFRNNRDVLTLKCTYPIDLEGYVDSNFFSSLKPNWRKDSIIITDDKKEEIKVALESNFAEASESILYNSWEIQDLDFLLSLKELALENSELGENLIQVFHDSLQNDSVSLMVYQLSQEFDHLEEDAFWKLLRLKNATSLIVLDSLSKGELPVDLDDIYDYDYTVLTDSVEYSTQLLTIFHENTTTDNQLELLNMEILSYMDSSAYIFQPLQDSIVSWSWRLLIEDTTFKHSSLLGTYLSYLKECPFTESSNELFLECINYDDIEIQAIALITLISNGIEADDEIMERMLENRFYRFRILKVLSDKGMLNVVPEMYLTKQAIAEDQVFAENEYSIENQNSFKLRFLEVRKIKVDGEKKLVHLFRMDINSEKYVVIVGYQPKSKGISFENELYKEMQFERTKDIPEIQEVLFNRVNGDNIDNKIEELTW